tara:strand:- start:931 stop:2091 length:1161 start_codon:yes stop_codon:yes gene_type:complete
MSSINYNSHHIDANDIKSVVSTLKGPRITQGLKIKEFEKKLSKKFKCKYCSVVSSGTAALHLTALSLGFKKKDVIISSPLTFLAGANAVNYCGAKPVFVDIETETQNLDPKKLEKKIKSLRKKNEKVKAVIATDYAGHPCDWKSLKKLSLKYNFYLINDNCHAIGAKYFKDIGYAAKYADVVIHSYHAVKNITTGEGGSVLTNSKKIYNKIQILRNHGLVNIRKKSFNKNWPFEMKYLGYNYRITDFQCALGISQLAKLEKFLIKKKKIAKIYFQRFRNIKNLKVPTIKENIDHSFHLFPIQINFKRQKFNKNKFISYFKKKNINLQVHYFPIHMQPYYKKKFKFKKNDFPNSVKFYESAVSLPIFYNLKKKDINKVVHLIRKKVS